MQLYVYDHCPFCVKARMIFGLKNIPVGLQILLNDDEETPVRMIGQKMVPILQKDDGTFMPESMDIVHYIDQQFAPIILNGPTNPKISQWLKDLSSYSWSLVVPRYAQADFAEFATPAARDYFILKKQSSADDFANKLQATPEFIHQVNGLLLQLAELIQSSQACNGVLSTDDIHLFAQLRGLSIVKGIQYPAKVEAYRQTIARLANVNLLDHSAI